MVRDCSGVQLKTCISILIYGFLCRPAQIEELIHLTTPQTRDILVKENPTAEIVKVMMTKFPELEKKKARMAVPSTKSFMQQRSLLQKNPASVSEQDGEVQICAPVQHTKLSSKAAIETLQSESLNDLHDNYDRLSIKHQLDYGESAVSTGNYQTRGNETQVKATNQKRKESIELIDKSDRPDFIATPPRIRPDEVFRRSRIDLRSEGSKIPLPSDRSPNMRRSTEATVRAREALAEFRSSIPKPHGRSLFSASNIHYSNIVTEKDKDDGSLGDSLDRPFHMSEDFSPSPSLPSNVTVREKRRPLLNPLSATPVPSSSNFEEEPPTVTRQSPVFSADYFDQHTSFLEMNDEVLSIRSNTTAVADEHDVANEDIDETMFIDRKVHSSSMESLDREKAIATSFLMTTEPSAEEILENVRQVQLQLNVIKNVSDQKEMGIPMKRRSVKKEEETLSYEVSNPDSKQQFHEVSPQLAVSDSLDRSENPNASASVTRQEPQEVVRFGGQTYGREFGTEGVVIREKEMQARRFDVGATALTFQPKEPQLYRNEFGGATAKSEPNDRQTFAEVETFQSYRHDFGVDIPVTQIEEHQAHRHQVTNPDTGYQPSEEQRAHESEINTENAMEDVFFTNPHIGNQGERAKLNDDSIFTGADFTVDRHMMRRRDDRLGIETTERTNKASLRVLTEENLKRRGGELSSRDKVPRSSLESKRPSNQSAQRRGVQSDIVANRNQADENDFWEKAHQYASNEDKRFFSSEHADDIDRIRPETEQHGNSGQFKDEYRDDERHSKPYEAVPETLSQTSAENAQRTTRESPSSSVPDLSLKTAVWTKAMLFYFVISLGVIFGASGLLRAITTIRDSHVYHHALLSRIGKFETSIAESYKAVRKLEDNYVVWSEYVRKLAQEDEASASLQLESIQREVEKWQVEMKEDLEEFKQSLAIDLAGATFASAEVNMTEDIEKGATVS